MTAAVTPLFGGRQLAEWIRDGGRPERRPRAYFARLRWHAYWFEHNWKVQEARLANATLPDDPIFILGPWRSGTTALHELLAAALRCQTPQTWQCFNPSTCFLTPPPAHRRCVERPMDHGRIETHSAQEDEFALLLLGEPSVYRAFIDPRRLSICGRELWDGGRGRLNRWLTFVRGLHAKTADQKLLLKSPSHTFRLPALRERFPRARFIWIGRHPGEVLASNVRMWQAMTAAYGLWTCPPTALDTFLREMLRAWANVLTNCIDAMPGERMLWVDFEELRSDPKALLERVLRFIEPNVELDTFAVARALNETPPRFAYHQRGSPPVTSPADPASEQIEKLMAAARQRFLAPRPPHFFLSPPLGVRPGGLRS